MPSYFFISISQSGRLMDTTYDVNFYIDANLFVECKAGFAPAVQLYIAFTICRREQS